MEKLTTTGTTYFARNNKKVIESLFTGGSTAAGTFKALKGRVMFYDMQGKLFAALVGNDNPFFVNACTLDNGKTFYQHSTGDIAERKLGIAGLGYMAQRDVAANVAKQVKEVA